MANRDLDAALRYHEATKHSYLSVRESAHHLDWSNQPLAFKIYRDLEPIPLPGELRRSGGPALTAIAGGRQASGEYVPDLSTLAYLLYFSAGITRRRQYPGGETAFRAASCTGALYEIELYVVCQDLAGLPAGVYHFGPADFALRELRRGDHRGWLADATAGEPAVAHAPVSVVCTGTYWRNAWKYRARTYRHFGWDNGTILANLLASGAAVGAPAGIVCGFVDATVNDLLGLDTIREVAFSIVPLGRVAGAAPKPPPIAPIGFRTVPLSREEVDYPVMREMHTASSLALADEVREWRAGAARLAERTPRAPTSGGRRTPLAVLPDRDAPPDTIEDVVRRRGSTRRFHRGATWTFEQLSTALHRATAELPADFLATLDGSRTDAARRAPLLNDLYLIVHAIEGLAPGAYALHRHPFELELLKEGRFRRQAGYLGLEQQLPADACAVVFFLADQGAVLQWLGNRGYRAAQLEAGILGGKLYLAAYAQRLGASGLTFYDDDVVAFFSPHAAGKSAIFCMTLGRSAKRAGPSIDLQEAVLASGRRREVLR